MASFVVALHYPRAPCLPSCRIVPAVIRAGASLITTPAAAVHPSTMPPADMHALEADVPLRRALPPGVRRPGRRCGITVLGLATSPDGISGWVGHPGPVLSAATKGDPCADIAEIESGDETPVARGRPALCGWFGGKPPGKGTRNAGQGR